MHCHWQLNISILFKYTFKYELETKATKIRKERLTDNKKQKHKNDNM